MLTINQKARIIVVVMISICALLLSCYMISEASAQNSYVEVEATSDGRTFNFTGNGAYWDWYIDVYGLDVANVDLTNEWDKASSTVKYEEIGDGEIFVKVSTYSPGDEWYYFEWKQMPISGDGTYVPPGSGGRSVTLVNSTNVSGYIEYPERSEKAVFQFDTTHREADLTVVVHNGEVLENATVSLINGNPTVVWTDENGEAKFTPGTGTYHLIVEHENFSSMLVDDLYLEADKSYHIQINMTDCITSKGVAICTPDTDDLIVYYKNKEPAMNAISPQGFVDYFADQMRTCAGGENNCADGTLQWMADDWGIYPENLNVLLYDCTFTELDCEDGWQAWEIEYVVKNYQQYECTYTVTLVYNGDTIELGDGTLPATWSTHAKTTTTSSVMIEGCDSHKMYLVVESERADN